MEPYKTPDWPAWVTQQTGTEAVLDAELIQTLWGGYGELLRVTLQGGAIESAILKRVSVPEGVDETVSHQRKMGSYRVEQNWYRNGAHLCPDGVRVARCYATLEEDDSFYLLLEDLSGAGFSPVALPSADQTRRALHWLAEFHAHFLDSDISGLWEKGTYWHLGTRQAEWERMPPGVLKELASELDSRLSGARFQTLVHGDAKPANFLWSEDGTPAAVDFQYIGRGCGIRDVALFVERYVDDNTDFTESQAQVDRYFDYLRDALCRRGHDKIADDLESEWRSLYPVAWCDYYRFRLGWSLSRTLQDPSPPRLEAMLSLL